jgi:hypothetical protein
MALVAGGANKRAWIDLRCLLGIEIVPRISLFNLLPHLRKRVVGSYGQRKLPALEFFECSSSVWTMGVLGSERQDLNGQSHRGGVAGYVRWWHGAQHSRKDAAVDGGGLQAAGAMFRCQCWLAHRETFETERKVASAGPAIDYGQVQARPFQPHPHNLSSPSPPYLLVLPFGSPLCISFFASPRSWRRRLTTDNSYCTADWWYCTRWLQATCARVSLLRHLRLLFVHPMEADYHVHQNLSVSS